MSEAIQAASIYILASLKDEVTGELKRVKSGVDGFASGVRKNISLLGDFGSSLSSLVAPLGLIGGIGISTAAGFDQAMATVGARAGLVGKDLDDVRKFALDMGAQFPVSSTEAADALGELLASGMDTKEAMATLPAVLTAASASGESLGVVTDVVTNILAAFNMEAAQSTDVVNILAAAAAVSKADIASLGAGFTNVGAIASQFGLSVKDTAAALAILSNAGIGGAEAGTALKSLFTQLNSKVGQKELKSLGTSLYYTNAQIQEIVKTNKSLARDGFPPIPVPKVGEIRPFADVLADIEKKLGTMTDAQRNKAMDLLGGSFGKVALSALLAGDSIEEVERNMDKQASASEVAEARMSSFKGIITNLQGSVEALMINAFTPFMNNILAPMGTQVTNIVNGLNDWVSKNPELMTQIVGVGAALLLMGSGAVGVSFVVGKVMDLATAFGGLAMAAAPVILPLAVIAGLVYAYLNNLGGFKEWVDGIGEAFRNADPLIKAAVISLFAVGGAFLFLKGSLIAGQLAIWITEIGTALGAAYAAGGIVGVASTVVSGLAGAFSLLLAPLAPLAAGLWALLAPFLTIAAPIAVVGGLITAYLTNLGGFKDWIDGFGNWMRTEVPKAWAAAGQAIGGFVDTAIDKIIAFKDWVLRGILTPFKDVISLVQKMAIAMGDTALASSMQDLLNIIAGVNQEEGGGSGGGATSPRNERNVSQRGVPGGMQDAQPNPPRIPGNAVGGIGQPMSEIGENDSPELVRQGGKTYLVPGNKGGHATVYPRYSGSGGGGGTLNIGNLNLPNVRNTEEFVRELEDYARSKNLTFMQARGV